MSRGGGRNQFMTREQFKRVVDSVRADETKFLEGVRKYCAGHSLPAGEYTRLYFETCAQEREKGIRNSFYLYRRGVEAVLRELEISESHLYELTA